MPRPEIVKLVASAGLDRRYNIKLQLKPYCTDIFNINGLIEESVLAEVL